LVIIAAIVSMIIYNVLPLISMPIQLGHAAFFIGALLTEALHGPLPHH
jgi:hypothetical protein